MDQHDRNTQKEILKTLRDILHELRWRFRNDPPKPRPSRGDE